MEKLLEILEELCPDTDFENEHHLIDDDILTSLDVVMLVGELNDSFGVEITAEDLLPENFNSAEAIYALIRRLQEE